MNLFDPFALGPHQLRNRLVMAPMTRSRATAGGVPTEAVARYYRQRATAGLIIAEASSPNAVGRTYPNTTAIHTAAHVEGWRRVTAAVGGPMFLQLQHGGRVGHPATSGHRPIAPSALALPEPIHTPSGKQPAVVPRAMTAADLRTTIADFAAAARRAIDAGFAGVEVHSANGYLLHQFLAVNTNNRTDEYGGSVANRVRFTAEVVAAVSDAIGAARVGLRISPGTTVNGIAEGPFDPLYPALLHAIRGHDLAYLHVALAGSYFAQLRELWPGVLIANPVLPAGGIPVDGGRAAAELLLAAGADLIALGRPFLANPDLVERLRTGAPVNQVRDRYLMYVGGETGYTDYPALSPA